MSIAFRRPYFPPFFQKISLLITLATISIFCPQTLLAADKSSLSSAEKLVTPASFCQNLKLEKLENAELQLHALQKEQSKVWVAEAALQLANAIDRIGCREKAKTVLESYWPQISQSQFRSHGWLLRARLASQTDDGYSWHCYQQAEALLEIQDWPSEDSSTYIALHRRLKERFELQMQTVTRLSSAGMYKEAVNTLDQLLQDLQKGSVPGYDLQTIDGVYLYRQLKLQQAEFNLALLLPKLALLSLENWPHPSNNIQQGRLRVQEIQYLLLQGRILLMEGFAEKALAPLSAAIQMAEGEKEASWFALQSFLNASQAFAKLDRQPEAFELLEEAKGWISSCSKEQQSLAQGAWLEQKCQLLCQSGRIHAAIEEIHNQISEVPSGGAKNDLIFLKARLLNQLDQSEAAALTYLDLFESSPIKSKLPLLQSALATSYLLENVETSDCICLRLSQFLLRREKPLLDERSMLRLCQWAISHSIAAPSELLAASTPWLEQVQEPSLKATAHYLLATLCQDNTKQIAQLKSLLANPNTPNDTQLLAKGWLIYLEEISDTQAFEQLLELTTSSLSKGCNQQQQLREQLLTFGALRSLKSDDPLLWQKAYEKLVQSKPQEDGAKWVQLELGFRLHADNPLESCESACTLAKKTTYWGLRSTLSHVRYLMQTKQTARAIERMQQWLALPQLSELLQQEAMIEWVDLLHRKEDMVQARLLIQKIIERWNQFELRPWLELRRYSLREYQQKCEGSEQNLHSVIINYRQHPVALCAYYLKAVQGTDHVAPSAQLRLWEEVDRKAQELDKLKKLDEASRTLAAMASLQRSKLLKTMQMQRQAIGCLKGLLSQPYTSQTNHLVEQQARFELAQLLQEVGESESARVQLIQLGRDPQASHWASKAQLELARLDLTSEKAENALSRLKEVSAPTTDLQAERLLLAAQAWQLLGFPERAESHLKELFELDNSSLEIELFQIEALGLIHTWYETSDRGRSEKAFQEMNRRRRLLPSPPTLNQDPVTKTGELKSPSKERK